MKLTDLDGMRVVRSDYAPARLWVLLPKALWRSAGRCDCNCCNGSEGFYDTMGVQDGVTTWVVHYPQLHRAGARRTVAAPV